ncbi:MAG: DUF1203 domain-containing protein [Actinobacteria bacterium]|nr:DUF1203 domain-containing protein [Actinomycetota bacterium]
MSTTTPVVVALDPARLAALRAAGVDHGGNPIEPFTDGEGGWPLRCCLRDSTVGERIAIVAWQPFTWTGVYAEIGPVVIHAGACAGFSDGIVPPQFEDRRQLLRPYTADHRIAYDHTRIVEVDESLADAINAAFEHDDIQSVLVRNVLAGCLSFEVVRGVTQ